MSIYSPPTELSERTKKKEEETSGNIQEQECFSSFLDGKKDKRDLLFSFLFLRNNLQFHVSHLLIFAPLVYSACSPSISCSPHFLFPLLAWKRCSLTVRHKTKQPRTHKRDPFPIV